MTLADLTRRLASVLPTELVTNRADPPSGAAPVAPGSGSSRGPFAAMRHRNYRLFWIGQVLSLVGTWMQSVSEPWLVLLLGGSPLQLGIVLALEFAPSTVLAPLGGVLADRMDKRKVIIWTKDAAAPLRRPHPWPEGGRLRSSVRGDGRGIPRRLHVPRLRRVAAAARSADHRRRTDLRDVRAAAGSDAVGGTRVRVGDLHRPELDAHDQHHQRDRAGRRSGPAPRTGDVALRPGLRRILTDRWAVRRRRRGALGCARGIRAGCTLLAGHPGG